MTVSRRIVLRFPRPLVDQPIIYKLVKDYNLMFNILKASVTPKEEGLLALELSGTQADYNMGVKFLTEAGVDIQPIGKDIFRDEDRCTHCGACITMCPTDAFYIEGTARWIRFEAEKCIACGICIKACPARAMEMTI